MYKHILVPTDGSDLSDKALRGGLKMAKAMDAKLSALHVTRPFHVIATDARALTDTREEFEKHSETAALKILGDCEAKAAEEGVRYEGSFVPSDNPFEAIIRAAQDKGCDLILMASHGRRGIQGLLLGSETQKVLTHSKIPVLVYR